MKIKTAAIQFTYFLIIQLICCVYSSSDIFKNSTQNSNLRHKEDAVLETISKLYKSILSKQSKNDVSFRLFPPRFAEINGMFSSYIHLNVVNFSNNLVSKFFRETVKALDMNMFVSNFVVTILLEVEQLNLIDLNKLNIVRALKSMLLFKDKNWENDIPVYTFWKQIKLEKYWSQYPESMVKLMENQPNVDFLINILKKLKLKDWVKFLESFKQMWKSFQYAYRIPADLDDTSTALALTALLSKINIEEYNKVWVDKNKNIKGLFEKILKFAYRPFTNDNYTNPMDPRTYFWIHDFLNQTHTEEPERELILPNTWLWDWKELNNSFPDVTIPFSVNNIDLNVAGNFLFGLTNLILNYKNQTLVEEAFTDEMLQMLGDTTDLFVYVIKNEKIIERPDLTILYYPSIFDFYWLSSRVSSTIKNALLKHTTKNQNKLIEKLKECGEKLEIVLRNQATQLINDKLKVGNKKDEKYLVEFLGNFDNKTRNEDAVFATSLGLNTLLNTWTYEKDGMFIYDSEISDDTKENIKSMVNYIINHSTGYFVSNEGAFFSGSVHNSHSSFPFFYPANFFSSLNGTKFEPNDPSIFDTPNFSIGIDKYIEDVEFQKLVKEKHYGVDTPLVADDLNSSVFPFWSSPAITESLALLGISKYYKVINQ